MIIRCISVVANRRMVACLALWLALWGGKAGADANLDRQLVKAAAFADLQLVQSLLDQGADVDARRCNNWTPLLATASGRYWGEVKVTPGAHEALGLVSAFESGLSGRNEVARLLLARGADVEAKDEHGVTALMFAAGIVRAELVRELLSKGADVNASDAYGTTALMLAVKNAGDDVVQLLLENGAQVDAKDRDGRTALMLAASFGPSNLPGISPLQKEIVPNIDWKAFQSLAWSRRAKVVRLLRAHGAEVTLTIAALLGDEAEVQRLLADPSDVDEKNAKSKAALVAAAEMGHSTVVRLLLEKSPDVNANIAGDAEALLGAARNGHVQAVRLLLDKGVAVSGTAGDGGSALLEALQKPGTAHAAVAELLIEKGADVNVKDNNGYSPLMWAAANGHTEVVKTTIA